MLQPGGPAPAISAPNQRGESVSPPFDELTVLYFYPEDGTPGYTTEAAQFAAERDVYEEAGVAVYGVSTDSVEPHRAFADEQHVPFDLLSDPEGDVAVEDGSVETHEFAADENGSIGIRFVDPASLEDGELDPRRPQCCFTPRRRHRRLRNPRRPHRPLRRPQRLPRRYRRQTHQ